MKKPDLKKWFKRTEKEKFAWGKEVSKTLAPQVGKTVAPQIAKTLAPQLGNVPESKSPFKNIQQPFEKRKVYRIGYLRTGKRVLAAILLFLNGIFFIGSTSVAWGFVFFGANCFIIVDYIWRTKHAKVDFDW